MRSCCWASKALSAVPSSSRSTSRISPSRLKASPSCCVDPRPIRKRRAQDRNSVWQQSGHVPRAGGARLARCLGNHGWCGPSQCESSRQRSAGPPQRQGSRPSCEATHSRRGFGRGKYSGHSLRAGLVTSAAVAGVSERLIMRQTGPKSLNTLVRYVRDASLFRDNAAAGVGL